MQRGDKEDEMLEGRPVLAVVGAEGWTFMPGENRHRLGALGADGEEGMPQWRWRWRWRGRS